MASFKSICIQSSADIKTKKKKENTLVIWRKRLRKNVRLIKFLLLCRMPEKHHNKKVLGNRLRNKAKKEQNGNQDTAT